MLTLAPRIACLWWYKVRFFVRVVAKTMRKRPYFSFFCPLLQKFARLKDMKHIALISAVMAIAVNAAFAGDEPDKEFKEQLASLRDSYASALNMAMEDANDGDPAGWFKARDEGLDADWDDLEFEPPTLSFFSVEEIPYGYRISGSTSDLQLNADVFVWTRNTDIQYTVTYRSGTNAAAKEIAKEVFQSEQSDYPSKCAKGAVTCYNGKSTFGDKKKGKKKK